MQLEDLLGWMAKASAKIKAVREDSAQLRCDLTALERQPGPPGQSAYDIAVAAGFRGTEAEWQQSLRGKDGIDAQAVDVGSVVDQVLARMPAPQIPTVEEIAQRVVVPPARVPSAAEIAALVPRAEPSKTVKGDPGPMGPMPDHQWDGSKLRFQKPSGWGAYVDLQGPKGADAQAPRGYQGGPIFVEGTGGAIDDGITGTETTWSSQKIEIEIASAVGAPSAGNPAIPFAFGDIGHRLVLANTSKTVAFGVEVHIATPFNGVGATLAIGTVAQPSVLVASSQLELAVAINFDISPNVSLLPGDDVWLTFNPGSGATQGAGWIVVQQVSQP